MGLGGWQLRTRLVAQEPEPRLPLANLIPIGLPMLVLSSLGAKVAFRYRRVGFVSAARCLALSSG
jgi:hypothetical protein